MIKVYHDLDNVPNEKKAWVQELVFRWGKTYDAYVTLQPNWSYFFGSNNSGLVCFREEDFLWLTYRYHVLAGMLTDGSSEPVLLDDFCNFCSSRSRRPLIYNVDERDVPLFRSRGFEVTKWGEEPIVDLQSTDWRGKKYEWVRRQENYCLRQGLKVREIHVGEEEDWAALRLQIEALSERAIRRTAHGREMLGLYGSLAFDHFYRRRLFVAESAEGLHGIVVCNPYLGGRGWAAEIYRQAADAPQGTIAFMFMQIMRVLKAEGVTEFSLSLVPGLNCSEQPDEHSKIFAWMLGLWWDKFNWLFDLRGIYHFKSRFRPRYETRYIAALNHFSFVDACTFADFLGLLKPNPVALARSVFSHARKRGVRRTLASPN